MRLVMLLNVKSELLYIKIYEQGSNFDPYYGFKNKIWVTMILLKFYYDLDRIFIETMVLDSSRKSLGSCRKS